MSPQPRPMQLPLEWTRVASPGPWRDAEGTVAHADPPRSSPPFPTPRAVACVARIVTMEGVSHCLCVQHLLSRGPSLGQTSRRCKNSK